MTPDISAWCVVQISVRGARAVFNTRAEYLLAHVATKCVFDLIHASYAHLVCGNCAHFSELSFQCKPNTEVNHSWHNAENELQGIYAFRLFSCTCSKHIPGYRSTKNRFPCKTCTQSLFSCFFSLQLLELILKQTFGIKAPCIVPLCEFRCDILCIADYPCLRLAPHAALGTELSPL